MIIIYINHNNKRRDSSNFITNYIPRETARSLKKIFEVYRVNSCLNWSTRNEGYKFFDYLIGTTKKELTKEVFIYQLLAMQPGSPVPAEN